MSAAIKLTAPQEAMLRRVVATNGGGVHAGFSEGQRETRVLLRLHEMGLVQGKAGMDGWAVHTKQGWAWVKANPPKTN